MKFGIKAWISQKLEGRYLPELAELRSTTNDLERISKDASGRREEYREWRKKVDDALRRSSLTGPKL